MPLLTPFNSLTQLQQWVYNQLQRDNLHAPALSPDAIDGVRMIFQMAHPKPGNNGIASVLSLLSPSQLERTLTHLDALRDFRDNAGHVVVYGVFTPSYRSSWHLTREAASEAFLDAANEEVKKDSHNGIRELSLSPTRVHIDELADYLGDDAAKSHIATMAVPCAPVFPKSEDDDAPTFWSLLTPTSKQEIEAQIAHIESYVARLIEADELNPSTKTSREERYKDLLRFSEMLAGHKLAKAALAAYAIADKDIADYLKNLSTDQWFTAKSEASKLLKKKTSRGQISLWVIKDSEKTYYLNKADADADFLSSAKKLAAQKKGRLDLDYYEDTFFIEEAADLMGINDDWFDDFLAANPDRILPIND